MIYQGRMSQSIIHKNIQKNLDSNENQPETPALKDERSVRLHASCSFPSCNSCNPPLPRFLRFPMSFLCVSLVTMGAMEVNPEELDAKGG